MFPDVISSESVINFYSSVEIKESGEDLVTPKMENKNRAKCGGVIKNKFCVATKTTPKTVKEFIFLSSNKSESLEVNSNITISDENVTNLIITQDNLTLQTLLISTLKFF